MSELYYSGNKKRIRLEDIISSISNLPKSKFEEIVLGYFIFFDTNLYFDNQESIHLELFSDINKTIFEKFIEFKNGINRKIEKINKSDFEKLFSDYEKDCLTTIDKIYKETSLNLAETSITPQVDSFLNYLADLEYNYRERKVILETLKFVNLLADPKRKQQRIEKKELALAQQLQLIEKVIHSKNEKYPLLGYKEILQVTNDLTDPNKALKPIETQFVDLEKLGYIFPCELIVIAGRPGMGKTSLAMCLYDYWLRKEKNTIFFSLEMSKEQMTHKLMSLSLGINTKKYINKETGVLELSEELKEKWSFELATSYKNITLVDKPGISISEIKKYIIQRNYNGRVQAENEYLKEFPTERHLIPEYIRNKNDIKIIFVDYLQILNLNSANPTRSLADKISEVTTSLKSMCLEHHLTVFLISQLNRESQQGDDKRPTMSQLKGSGSIEQDADKIWLLHREDYYLNKDVKIDKTIKDAITGIAEIIVDKNRGGETGTVYADWNGKLGVFSNLSSKLIESNELDENNNPIFIEYSPDDRIKEYKNLSKTIEEINKGGGYSQPDNNSKNYANQLGEAINRQKSLNNNSDLKKW